MRERADLSGIELTRGSGLAARKADRVGMAYFSFMIATLLQLFFFAAPRPRQIVGVLIAKYQKGGHGDRIRRPSLGPIPALAIIRDASFVFAGGGVRPEARRRGAGSLLLREIRSLMHNLTSRC